jgi:hypothetical protein
MVSKSRKSWRVREEDQVTSGMIIINLKDIYGR